MITRLPDWPERLQTYLDSCEVKTFGYGRFDCAIFATEAVQSITGTIFMVPRYSSLKEALAAVGSVHKLRKFMRLYAVQHELPSIPPLTAQRGDVVLIRRRKGYSLGVIGMNGMIHAPGKRALLQLPLTDAVEAWRV